MASVRAGMGLATLTLSLMIAAGLFAGLAASSAGAAELTVATTGNGSGYVTANAGGINCGHNDPARTDCAEDYPSDSEVVLTAHTDARFLGFSGACNTAVDIRQCTITMDESKAVTANFGKYDAAVTLVTNSITIGSPLSASAAIEGGLWPKQGNLQFSLYGPSDPTCSGVPLYVSQSTVTGVQQTYGSGNFVPTQAGNYYWTASYSGDAGNNPAASACNAPLSVATVSKFSAFVSSNGSDTTIGGSISNVATLSGYEPTGSIEMRLYGPGDPNCAGTPLYTETVTADGSGTYQSAGYTPTQVGTYRWVSAYSGDDYNNAASSNCASAAGRSIVSGHPVALAITATDGPIGSSVQATVSMSQGQDPSGTITFSAYGPDDPTCSGSPVFDSTHVVSGNGQYESSPFSPVQAGEYHWVATYPGDPANSPATTQCGDADGTSTIAKATPALSAPAPAIVTIGSALPVQTTLSSGHAPTGEITFAAYGPGDATCSQPPAFSGTAPASGNGDYGTNGFTPTATGSYRWIVSYAGDVNNQPASTVCATESLVAPEEPAIALGASDGAIGGSISATASLTGGYSPSGTIDFAAFGPDDAQCSGQPAFTATVTVNGNGDYGSGDFTPDEAGVYRWTAFYSGDGGNEPVGWTCAGGTASTVAPAEPTISAGATSAEIGSAITAAATLEGGFEPGGTVTLEAYGPGSSDCSGAPAFTQEVQVSGNGEYGSGDFVPESAGEYRWIAEYSGDTENEAAATECGAEGTTSTVTKAKPGLTTTASGDIRLGDEIRAAATVAGGHEPGGEIGFRLFGPDDPSCSGDPVFAATVPVDGDGRYDSPQFEPRAVGTYRWVASYSGDSGNERVEPDCATGVSVEVSPFTCPAVDLRAVSYRPAEIVRGRMVLGVRARVTVSRPSDLQIAAKLRYRLGGKGRTASLGSYTLDDRAARSIRLALPRGLRSKLAHKAKVRLTLKVTATPHEAKGCVSPPTTTHSIKTRVVRVLKSKKL